MNIANITSGVEAIKKDLQNISESAGVYRFIDSGGTVLYVGKAKNLKKRLTSYTHPERLEYRIQSMISQIKSLEIITTKNEIEALLLEANLIKKFEPKYNILMKDDKSYPYILITADHSYPRITKHRGERKIKGSYYGPFASAGAVNQSIADLQKAFLIRPCSDNFFASRKRPCLEYQIKRCSAPCVNKISEDDYKKLVDDTKKFLSGKSREVQDRLVEMMESESQKMNYENAAKYRDRIKALNHIQSKQTISITNLEDADALGLYIDKDMCCIQVFFFRNGCNLGNKAFFIKNTDGQEPKAILEAFIPQLYNNENPPPGEIIISASIEDTELLEEALSSIAGYRVKITSPQKGDKKQLIDNAVQNAINSLKQKQIGRLKQTQNLEKIAEIFGLVKIPERIEVYDNSHIMGQYQVGAMIVAGTDGFDKKSYRRFNIKNENTNPGDDYAMLREVLTRRLKRLEHKTWPDLILIDGGAGHLSVAEKIFTELGLENKIVFACISKGPDRNAGREQFHMPGKKAFTLPHNDSAMHYLQVLRDEAHRFAIGSHRKKRAKSSTKSALDDIEGIGSKRKKMLINHFGSVEGIKQAGVSELIKLEGINKATAQKIIDGLK